MTSAVTPSVVGKKRRILLRVGVAIASVVVSLLVAEIALRVLGHDPQLSQPGYLRWPTRAADASTIMIDPRFREARHYRHRGGDVVVTLGDSFTAGYPVDSENRYPAVLERELHRNGWDVDVINVGMGNSGPGQHLRILEDHVLPRVRPSVVVWAFYGNDIRDNLLQPGFELRDGELRRFDGDQHWLVARDSFHQAMPFGDLLLDVSYLYRCVLKGFESSAVVVDDAARRRSFEKIRLQVERMEALSREHGFRVCYALIVPQSVYLARDTGHLEEWMKHFATVDFIMVNNATKGAPGRVDVFHASPGDRVFAEGARDGNHEGDRHFNETGYRLLAEALVPHVLACREPVGVVEASSGR